MAKNLRKLESVEDYKSGARVISFRGMGLGSRQRAFLLTRIAKRKLTKAFAIVTEIKLTELETWQNPILENISNL